MSELQEAFKWLFGRDAGMSSKAIMGHMVAGVSDGTWPSDPSDLARCLRLLRKFPQWETRLSEMAAYGPEWANYAHNWDRLRSTFISEAKSLDRHQWSAPKTYALMRELLAKSRLEA